MSMSFCLGLGLNAWRGVGVEGPITGTGPVLGALTEGDTLGERVTWGTYASSAASGTATILPPTREMSQNFGAWIAFDGDTVVVEFDVWQVRELVTDSAGTPARAFRSAVVAVEVFISAPYFTSDPAISGQAENGEVLTLSFSFDGNPPGSASIRWLKNGVIIPSQTGSTLTVSGASIGDVFKAQVQLTNSEGSTAWTDSNELTVSDGATIPPSITSPIADQSFTLNQGGGTVSVPYSIAGDALVFTLLDAPVGATVSGGNVNIPTGTAGAWDIGLRAENSLGSVVDTFQVLVDAAIYGTPVSMVQPVEGDTLGDVVTWGSMATNVGTLGSPTRQQQINGASWATYVSTTALVHPDTVAVRETWLSSEDVTRTDTTATFTVVGEPDPPVYPVLRASQDTEISTGATSLSVTMPSGRVSGDTLLAEVRVDGTPTITATGTWTLVRETSAGTTYKRLLYRKTSGADDTLTLTSSGAETLIARTFCYVGNVSVVDGTPSVFNSSNVGNLDLTTSAPTLWLVSLSFDGASNPTADPPAGYTAIPPRIMSGTSSPHVGALFGSKESTAASEDPGAWQNLTGVSNFIATITGLRNA